MTTEIASDSRRPPLDRPASSPVVRWLLGLFAVAAIVLVLAVLAAAFFALRLWIDERVAAQAVQAEVARLRAANQPMTADDLYRVHQVPANLPDATPAWQAALKSFDPVQFNNDAKGIAYVGNGDAALLRRGAGDSQLVKAEQFLATYDSTLVAIRGAASQPGECRFPVKFEQGFAAVTNSVNDVRTLVRLLSLDVHVQAARGNADKALESLAALFAASDAVSRQLTISEQLVHLATLSSAFGQTERLLSELSLSEAQLARLEALLAACDIQGSFTHSLIGERALGYQAFHQVGGVLPRSADCQKYLEVMTQLITFSAEALPTGRQNMQSMVAQMKAEQNTPAAEKHVLTALSLPALQTAFDAYAKVVAYRQALRVAIAAERFRLKAGHFPSKLDDLVPAYLPSIPLDPFDGQSLRYRTEDGGIVIYSIGPDEKDDDAPNPPGNSGAPDIVVRVSSTKPHSP